MSNHFVSVVIPVLNDSERLRKCLGTLEHQTYPKNLYEVIVVDNGSNEDIQTIVRCFKNTVFVRESYPTLHAARNRGILTAKGEILAFTDADCIPAEDWIEKGVQHIMNMHNCGVLAGRIEIIFNNVKRPTAVEIFDKLTAFRQKEYIKRWNFSVAANTFTLKKVIEKVGLFDGELKSGADMEWGRRIFKAGYKQIYADDVIVKHPARCSLVHLYKKHIRVVGGIMDINKRKIQSTKNFLIDLKDDWPKINDFYRIWKAKEKLSIILKIELTLIMTFLKLTRYMERLRLRLGGKSKWG